MSRRKPYRNRLIGGLTKSQDLHFVLDKNHRFPVRSPRFVPDLSKLSESQRKMVLAARPDGIMRPPKFSPVPLSESAADEWRRKAKHKGWQRREKRRLLKEQRRMKRLDRKKHRPPKAPDEPRYSKAYSDYLASPEWRAKKKQVFAARGYVCEHCKAVDVQLHVHHLTYVRLGHENLEDLAIVCRPCHNKAHARIF